MKDIIIGGYTLPELKKIQDAVRKDASKVVSEAIATATDAMDGILSFKDIDEGEPDYDAAIQSISAMAKVAQENLELAQVVSNISGVEYFLPYSTDWDSENYYYRLEDAGVDDYDRLGREGPVSTLMGKLEDMEHQSKQWHQSVC